MKNSNQLYADDLRASPNQPEDMASLFGSPAIRRLDENAVYSLQLGGDIAACPRDDCCRWPVEFGAFPDGRASNRAPVLESAAAELGDTTIST